MFSKCPTPIEIHKIENQEIFVKRDDLFALPPAPPMAKLRGINLLIPRLRQEGFRLIGVYGASASKVSHAVAAAASVLDDIECVVGYISTKRNPMPPSIKAAQDLGASLIALRPNVLNVCYNQVRKLVEARNGYMIPFGFELPEAVDAVAAEAATVPIEHTKNGTVVVCCGSGVTLAGIVHGLRGIPDSYIGVSSGRTLKNVEACLVRQNASKSSIKLVEPLMKYSEAAKLECPFPCDKYYDLKAWKFLTMNANTFAKPIFFWNVGAD